MMMAAKRDRKGERTNKKKTRRRRRQWVRVKSEKEKM